VRDIADVRATSPACLEAFAARGGLDDGYPDLVGFLQRIHARPAYQRALQRGGDYRLG
jgi:glutathione S-transferase